MRHEHTHTINTEMTIRRMDLTDEDREAVARLAELDSSETPDGAVLGLEIEDSLLAAISLDTGEVISDPFSRTDELRALLDLRASQISRRKSGRRVRFPRRRARPAVGGAPAGTITTLPRWG